MESLGKAYLNYTFKPKDLVPTPWMVAMALQADGWYLRSDIIWSKANPLPESVTDRPTKSHEYVFLLTKRPRYYWDAAAVAERAMLTGGGECVGPDKAARAGQSTNGTGLSTLTLKLRTTRNVRSVWSIATQPYAEAHFATMPEKLVERCVLAGSRLGDLVLDPFLGSGTVALVAKQLGRRAAGCDLSRPYLDLATARAHLDPRLPLEMLA